MNILDCSKYEVYCPRIVSSDNCYVIDENGKKYVDFESGVWCTVLGHNNKRVNKALTEQINKIGHVGYRYNHGIVDETARLLLSKLNIDNGKCLFLSSGSEAVEFGVQLSRKIVGKPLLLNLSNHYLSAYGISGNKSNENWVSIDWSKYDDNTDFTTSSNIFADIPFDKISAFVFEPGNYGGLVKLPPKALVTSISNLIKQNSGLIVVDEVTTGMGRTGKWFGFEHYGINPDIIACGKGLGNGYPVSAVIVSSNVADELEKTDFKYAQSHQNDPAACAVAKAVIEELESTSLIEKSNLISDQLINGFLQLARKHDCIKEVRGVGLMTAIEFIKSTDKFSIAQVHRTLFEKGFIAGLSPAFNTMRFYPPLTIEKDMINEMITSLDEILSTGGDKLNIATDLEEGIYR